MSFFRKKPFIILASVVVCALLLAAISHFGGGIPARLAGAVISPVEGLVSKIVSPLSGAKDNILSANDLREENERLRQQLDELTIKNRTAQEYIKENERLRELLHLREEMIDKEVLAASVVSADSDNFSYTITINRGSADGVSLEDAVVSTLGAVGRVTETGKHWARVTTLLSPEHALGVKVSRTGDIAVLEGDIALSKDRQCRLGYITGSAELIEGDIIVTSGTGGIYPPGITVGKVCAVRSDNSGKIDYATVEPSADFLKLYEVLVITDWSMATAQPEYVGDVDLTEQVPVPEPQNEVAPEDVENAQG